MIVVVTCWDYPRDRYGVPTSNVEEEYVSHGVNYPTMENICLPCEKMSYYKERKHVEFDHSINEWVLVEKQK